MKPPAQLGRLESVSLREAWPNEADDFTPWLAEHENLELLSQALDIPLTIEAVEKPVGAFAADILAKRPDTDQWVLIENQIAATDHRHLGQLLTYAAGLDARIIVWIAKEFRDEHRAAIDFLNRATTDDFSFFAAQIELYRIGASAYAPRFSLVAKPNDWSKRTKTAAQASDDGNQYHQLSREFWGSLIAAAKGRYPPLQNRSAYQGNWQTFETMRSGNPRFGLNACFPWDRSLRVEVYIGGSLAKAAFKQLIAKKTEIEAAFGQPLDWEELQGKQDSRISFYMPGNEKRENRERWGKQIEWLLVWAPKLANALRPFINALHIEGPNDEPTD
jgi:Domain of unknown function (DUF4268)